MGARSSVPKGLHAAGRRLWSATLKDYELAEHERVLLEAACRTADTCAALAAAADTHDGLTAPDGKVWPELIELRQQRIVLGRLLVALRVPIGESDAVPQYRGLRGVYGGGVA